MTTPNLINSNVLNALSSVEVLGLTLYGESRGESINGQIAVGFDIKNRFYANPSKYKTISSVCLEPLQYSSWNENDPNYSVLLELASKIVHNDSVNDLDLSQCMWVAQGVINGVIIDNVKNTLHYMTSSLFNSNKRPKWAANPKDVIVIGNQTFFNV